MSHHLWRYFLEDDVESFKKILANATTKQVGSKAAAPSRGGPTVGSPGGNKVLSTSPAQTRKSSGTHGKIKHTSTATLTKADLNLKDNQGLTLLHWVATSRSETAWEYAQALLEQPLVDPALPDQESAWTALHRALYFGKVSIARAILNRDISSIRSHSHAAGSLFKIKDREGNSPFDLYNASIAPRALFLAEDDSCFGHEIEEQDDASIGEAGSADHPVAGRNACEGDEFFVFGSNKNLNLGVGDEDDRQFPERILLKRPSHLLQRLRLEHLGTSKSRKNRLEGNDSMSASIDLSTQPPAVVEFKPVRIVDIQMSKLHTAVLTDDPEANLHVCGFGPGGRLGTGDESTRFAFTCVYGGGLTGQKVTSIGLGQDHTLAITSQGEVFSWGNNRFGQLGYSVTANKDEDPIQTLPRQIFGTLKREKVLGCAASRIHSVVYTVSNLYTFGKNEGQLGLVDSDARSLTMQTTPRAVAASLFQHSIRQVTAIDKATGCLLDNNDVWVFANYGYTKVKFPMDGFTNYFLPSTYSTSRFGSDGPNHIVKLGSGGETICALSSEGQVFNLTVSQSIEPAGKASTTNPVKIKNALSEPQRVWSPRKDSMACADVDVGQDGSIIICTKSGSVWRRIKRAKAKDAKASSSLSSKAKDYKFSRVPGLTCIASVRSNAFGSFVAIKHDWDVMRTQIRVDGQNLWQDIFDLFPFKALCPAQEPGQLEIDTSSSLDLDAARIRRAVLKDKDLESSLQSALLGIKEEEYDITLGSTVTDIRIPCHGFLLSSRSSVMLNGMLSLRDSYLFDVPEILTVEYDKNGKPLVLFKGVDILTLFNLVLYLYTDNIVDVWHYTRYSPEMTMRYKQVRVELMKTASALNLKDLERAARLQIEPGRSLARDLEQAYIAPNFFEHADLEIELKDTSYYAHRALLVQRCPFFKGMFAGFSGGGWVRSRYDKISTDSEDLLKVDLTHIDPEIFDVVLRYLYADTGPELFDEMSSSSLDEFLDKVMEVMATANELMLDRLSQVCQQVLGRYVTTRNICQLLNAVAPCSVTTFKVAALEYICLNLEIMLENHLLDELDDELMLDLDQVVCENQDALFSTTRRGDVAEEALLRRYPDLAERIEISQRRKVESMALRARRLQREEEEKVSRDPKSPKLTPKSPKLMGRSSTNDLLFDMDDEGAKSPQARPMLDQRRTPLRGEALYTPIGSPLDESPWLDSRGKPMAGTLPSPSLGMLNESPTPNRGIQPSTSIDQTVFSTTPTRSAASPWGSNQLRAERLDMKQIMAQADDRRHSNISAGLAAQLDGSKGSSAAGHGSFKVSQKERKRQLLEQQKLQSEPPQTKSAQPRDMNADAKSRPSAWQTVSSGNKISLKDVLGKHQEAIPTDSSTGQRSVPEEATASRIASGAALTLRQTVPGNVSKDADKAGKGTTKESAGQQRSVSSSVLPRPGQRAAGSSTKITIQAQPPSTKAHPVANQHTPPSVFNRSSSLPVTPRSVRHGQAPAEPSLQLSMADILAQQQMEKDVIKEAVAKRSLQEIQQEQEFLEWWDAEEKATRARLEAEERASTTAASSSSPGIGSRGGKAGRGRSRARPKAGRGGREGERGKGADGGTGEQGDSNQRTASQGGKGHNKPAVQSGNSSRRRRGGQREAV